MNTLRVFSTPGIVGESFSLSLEDSVVTLPAGTLSMGGAVLYEAMLQCVASSLVTPFIKGSDFAPHVMTDYTIPSPYVVSASEDYPTLEAWKAFDGIYLYGWGTDTATAASLTLDLGAGNAKSLYSYIVNCSEWEPSTCPKDWNLYGSNNGADWTLLDSQTNQTGWDVDNIREFVLDQSEMVDTYRYFKLDVLDENGGGWILIRQLEYYEPVVASNPSAKIAFGVDPVQGASGLGHTLNIDEGPMHIVGSTTLANMRCINGYSGIHSKLIVTPFYTG